MHTDDDALAARAVQDEEAFALLYRRYLAKVYRYILARTGERSEAEDLTSQVFLAVFEALPRYQGRGRFPAWLFSIARRKIADHYRSARPQTPLEVVANLAISGQDPLEQAMADEALGSLSRAIASLEEHEQELLRLRFAAGLAFSEIAALVNRKPAAVKMSLYRLLERLQKQLETADE